MALFIESTQKTPFICFKEGKIEIQGRSILENALKFYKPVLDQLEKYTKNPAHTTKAIFKLEYSNSDSNKALFRIIALLESLYKSGYTVWIEWYYEIDDDAIKNLGADFQSITAVPVYMVEYYN